MASVTIRDVRKRYGPVEVLHGVNVDIQDGEFVVLVGPSGCGKTTLLRMVAGLEDVSSGDILIDGKRVNEIPPKERDVAMVFQNYALYPHMTVRRNMSFALWLAKVPKAEIEARVKRAAEILGLEALLDRYPRALSGGQRQRVAMGRALVRNPKVFLFDEPLSNLDAKLRVHMRAEIKEIQQRLATTTIYVTHDQVEAMTMADKIVVMRAGHVEQIGAPLELYDHPANQFVAGFLGSPSRKFIEGEITPQGFASGDGTLWPLPEGTSPRRRAVYGIRPQQIALAPSGIPARIQVIEPTGAETELVLEAGGEKLIAGLRERITARPGETVHLRIDPAHVHLFDAETGARLPALAPA